MVVIEIALLHGSSEIYSYRGMATDVYGKIDNKDLLSRLNTKIESSEPTNVIEELQSIWSQLINHPINGIDTSFFDAGGNSLLLMDLFFALQAKYSDTITVNDLFEHNTIRQQAAFITSITGIEEK